MLIISGRGKRAIEDHFDRAPELEAALAGKEHAQAPVPEENQPDIFYVRQGQPRGLGHAVFTARGFVGHVPFLVLLPDEILLSGCDLVKRMMEVRRRYGGSVVALARVDADRVDRYGVVLPRWVEDDVCLLEDMVEKPAPADAPSNLAIIGRYVISPAVFGILENMAPGAGGEIQLTDAIKLLSTREPVHGVVYHGVRFDTGTLAGHVAATLYLARRRPDLWQEVERLLQ